MDAFSILFGSSALSSFGHLLEMAFGCGIAYAVLIRTGQWQGSHIEEYCHRRHLEAIERFDLITLENAALTSKITIGANKLRCENHAAECKKKIAALVKYFAGAAVLVSLLCIVMLFVSGIWNPTIPNYLVLFGVVFAFAPVPVGLGWTYRLIQNAETQIRDEYKDFYAFVKAIRNQLEEHTKRAMQELDNKSSAENPTMFQRLLSGYHLEPTMPRNQDHPLNPSPPSNPPSS